MGASKKKTQRERFEELEKIIADNDSDIRDALKKALSDKSHWIRNLAAEAIGDKGLRELLPDLINALDDSNHLVRMEVIESIGILSPKKEVALILVKYLQDKKELVRVVAAEALGEIGNRKVLNDLEKRLSDRSELVRSYAAEAIGQIGLKKSIDTLEKHLKRENDERAKVGFYAALYFLGKKHYIEDLLNLLKSEEYLVRRATANTLEYLPLTESERKKTLLALKASLKNEPTTGLKHSVKENIKEIRKAGVK